MASGSGITCCKLWVVKLTTPGERYTGNVEVSGSIPLCSTIYTYTVSKPFGKIGVFCFGSFERPVFLPLLSRHSLERLRSELEGLEALLRKQQASRADLEKQIERYVKEIIEYDHAMEIIHTKVSQPLDLEAYFPLDGHAQLQCLAAKMKQLKEEVSTQRERVELLHSNAAGHGQRLDQMKKQFEEGFPEQAIDEIAGNLDDVRSIM